MRAGRFDSFDALIEMAKSGAPSLELDESVMDFLFQKSSGDLQSREHWNTEVRLATMVNKLSRTFLKSDPRAALSLVDGDSKKVALRALSSTPGTLALCYHGGYTVLRRIVFGGLFADGVTIAIEGGYPAEDGGFSLFAARNAILDGHPVLMAPDGGYGKETGFITVLGARRVVADGAPFLAYATSCPTAWLDLVRRDHGFALEVKEGPRVQHGEKFPAFRDRLYAFYAAQMEAAFTGDPRNIVLVLRWLRIFKSMFKGRVVREKSPSRYWR